MPLNLVPNELVGYRIKPDWYNFKVVCIKRHGEASKAAGQEYETVLAYCKNIEFAASWLLQHVLRVRGEAAQDAQQALDDSVASTQALTQAVALARQDVLSAVAALHEDLKHLDLRPKAVALASGVAPDAAISGEPEYLADRAA